MSMADNIKNNVNKIKSDTTSEQELRELINSAASKSMKQFIQRLDSGEIPIDNIADFIRVMGAYKEINNIESTMEGRANSSTLPEIDLRQERVINDTINEGSVMEDEEGKIDVSSMTTEDVSELVRQMDIAQNKSNEEAF